VADDKNETLIASCRPQKSKIGFIKTPPPIPVVAPNKVAAKAMSRYKSRTVVSTAMRPSLVWCWITALATAVFQLLQ
jgi:hypothetical protein